MPDKTQELANLQPPAPANGVLQVPKSEPLDEEGLARQELASVTPSNEELLKIAAKCGPLPKWLDEEEPPPF
jgi:hypothetical protein